MYNILVTGSNGQLGSEIRILSKEFKNYNYYFTDEKDLDICEINSVRKYVIDYNIHIIINCAAYTDVDKAEIDEKLAYKVNFSGTKNLATVAKEKLCKLIHISTDYVFDGTNKCPYNEKDKPNPQGVYGKTKLAAEDVLKVINPANCIIIRTSWLYSKYGNNFVKTMLKLGRNHDEINIVSDQVGSPTYGNDLAKMILKVLPNIKNEKTTIFHYSNAGFCSWADFATEIFKIENIKCKVNYITTSEYPTLAKRPSFSVMNQAKIKKTFDLKIPYWKDSLFNMLKT